MHSWLAEVRKPSSSVHAVAACRRHVRFYCSISSHQNPADSVNFCADSGSGIGKACAVGLAKEGARGVMIADIDLEAAKAAAVACRAAISADSEWKPGDIRWVDEKDLRKANKDRKPKDEKKPAFRAEAVHVDVTKEKSVKGAVSHMVKTFGRIDYCINSAGVRKCPC